MEKTYKRIPFNIELAKNIQSGEIEGKIVCRIGCPARILCTDFNDEQGTFAVVVAIKENPVREKLIRVRTDGTYSAYESDMDLFIELPEETPKQYPYDRVKDKITDADRQEAEKTFPDSYNMQSAFISGVAYQICKEIDCQETPKHEKISMNRNKVMLMRRPDKKLKECEKQDLVWCELPDGILEVKIIGIIENDSKSVKHIWLKHTATGRSYYVNPSKSCWTKNPFKFEPFDKVLVRDDDLTNWQAAFFSHIESFEDGERFAITTSGDNYNLANAEIIPYEGNEHFVGTTDKPKEE